MYTKALSIVKRLKAHHHEAYFIGGAVRDKLLGLPVKDVDIVTSARPEQVVDLFRDRKVKEVGKAFGVVLVDDIEVATYRHDRYDGLNHKAVKVSYAKILLEDVSRRDLTINTIAMDPITNEIVDHFNGQKDLKDRIIRFVGNPKDRIKEDPNRILRACRFAAKIGGKVDPATMAALKETSGYIKEYVSPERISKEIMSAMKIRKAGRFFRLLHEIDVLKDIFPSLDRCFAHEHGNHHSEDVFEHQMISGDHVSIKYPLIKLAAYLHDVGKPASYDPVEQSFYSHEKTGAELLNKELSKLKFSNEETAKVVSLVKHHMALHFEHPTPKSVRRVLKKLHDDNVSFREMLRIYDADLVGSMNRAGMHLENRFRNLLATYRRISPELLRKEPVHSLHFLKLNGNDVMRIADIGPSRKVGQILNGLLEAVLEEPELNNVEDLTRLVMSKTMETKELMKS